jgi:hypothetical protein
MDAITESDARSERGKENYYSGVNYATENYRTEDYGFKRDYSQYGNGSGAFPYGDRTYGERTELNDCTDMNESLYSTSILTHTSVRGSGRGRDEDAPRRLDYFSRNY